MVGTPGETVDPEDFTNPVFETIELDPVDSSGAICVRYPLNWTQYVDNVDLTGAAGSRYWLDAPNLGDLVLGPRAGGSLLGKVRIRTGTTTASAANLFINSSTYEIARSTSSRRYKDRIESHQVDLAALLGLDVVTFNDRGELRAHDEWSARVAEHGLSEDDPEPIVRRYVGLIAEDVADAGLVEFVQFDDATGAPDGLMYDRFVTGLLQLAQQQQATIAGLSARVEQLESRNN
jgi:hypothetical protein